MYDINSLKVIKIYHDVVGIQNNGTKNTKQKYVSRIIDTWYYIFSTDCL